MTDKTLKPCPFCGSTSLETMVFDGPHWVQCDKCEATGPTGSKYDGEEGEPCVDWNTRTDKHTLLTEAIERVKNIRRRVSYDINSDAFDDGYDDAMGDITKELRSMRDNN